MGRRSIHAKSLRSGANHGVDQSSRGTFHWTIRTWGLVVAWTQSRCRHPPWSISHQNDYDQDVGIAVFHPDALDRHFETWGAAPANTESPLENKDGKPFIVGPDWGVQVFFKDGSKSPMQRIINVGGNAHADGGKSSASPLPLPTRRSATLRITTSGKTKDIRSMIDLERGKPVF